MQSEQLTLEEIEKIAFDALIAVGTSIDAARTMAVATRETEAEGIGSHGLAYIPIYAEHVQCGKVDGQARPEVERVAPALLRVSANNGFAHPAIDKGFEQLFPMAHEQGIAAMAVHHSYNCGVLGYHTRRMALAGFVGLGFTNAPASIAPPGGAKPVFGTNPFSIATPSADGSATVVIDQSASTIAKSEVMKYAREGREIPLGWAFDGNGQPTTNAEAGLAGSMAPAGGYKGAGMALMVEIMAAALTGAHLGTEAAPFSGTKGGPPSTGQFFIAIDASRSSDDLFTQQMERLILSICEQEGARIPGQGRSAKRQQSETSGVSVQGNTLDRIRTIIKRSIKERLPVN